MNLFHNSQTSTLRLTLPNEVIAIENFCDPEKGSAFDWTLTFQMPMLGDWTVICSLLFKESILFIDPLLP